MAVCLAGRALVKLYLEAFMCGTENAGSKGSTSEKKRGVVGLVVGSVTEGTSRAGTEP